MKATKNVKTESVESKAKEILRKFYKKLDTDIIRDTYLLLGIGLLQEDLSLNLIFDLFNIEYWEKAVRTLVNLLYVENRNAESITIKIHASPLQLMSVPTQSHFIWLTKFFAYLEASEPRYKRSFTAGEDIINILTSQRVPYQFDLDNMRFWVYNVEVTFI